MDGFDLQLRRKSLDCVKNFRLIDDDFMKVVFNDKASAELLLRIILDKPLNVEQVNSEYVISNIHGRSVRLDILASDENGTIYDIEVQKDNGGAHVKRARYNSSMLDSNVTEPGEQYKNIRETYVIFITENDILGGGMPLYHIERIITEMHKPFGDGAHIIYVNNEIKDETQLGKLMSDFKCRDASEMNYKILADRVRYFKENEKGVTQVCEAVEKLIMSEARKYEACGRAYGEKIGEARGEEKIINKMRAAGMTEEQINSILNISA